MGTHKERGAWQAVLSVYCIAALIIIRYTKHTIAHIMSNTAHLRRRHITTPSGSRVQPKNSQDRSSSPIKTAVSETLVDRALAKGHDVLFTLLHTQIFSMFVVVPITTVCIYYIIVGFLKLVHFNYGA